MLGKIGVGAALVWTVPTVLSSPAYAAGTPGPLACAGCATNTILNGSFETGDLTDWTTTGIDLDAPTVFQYIDQAFIVAPPVIAAPGLSFAVNLVLDDAIAQVVAIDAGCVGMAYALDLWHYAIGDELITLHFAGSGAPDITRTSTDIGGWAGGVDDLVTFEPLDGGIHGIVPVGTTALEVTVASSAPSVDFGLGQVGLDLITFVIACPN